MTQQQTGASSVPPKQEPPKPPTLGKFAVKQSKPSSPRMLVYGQGGIGKTTLGAKFPNPLFVCFEKGLNSDALKGTDYIDSLSSWPEFLELLTEFKDSAYTTIVLDTLDVMVAGLFNDYICSKFQKEGSKGTELIDFAAINYGKGTVVAQQEIKAMLNKLDEINDTGKLILILAHSQTKPFKNPTGEDYDTYTIKGNDKINDVVKCWADEVYFANFVVRVDRDGKATGKTRWLDCENAPAYFAKSRFGLTGMELDAGNLVATLRSKIKGGTAQ
jgi:hypothetical protein